MFSESKDRIDLTKARDRIPNSNLKRCSQAKATVRDSFKDPFTTLVKGAETAKCDGEKSVTEKIGRRNKRKIG